ncbi:MAG: hypothetical protein WB565_13310 [Acidimicrobiales bacterium]
MIEASELPDASFHLGTAVEPDPGSGHGAIDRIDEHLESAVVNPILAGPFAPVGSQEQRALDESSEFETAF